VTRKYFPARSTSETSSVRRGMCCRTILLLCLGWRRSALAIAHFSLRGTESLKMTRRLSIVRSTKFTLKNLQTQQVHQTQTWICTKYWKKITICSRLISTYIKKLDNHIWYFSQCFVSLLSFCFTAQWSLLHTILEVLLKDCWKPYKGCLAATSSP